MRGELCPASGLSKGTHLTSEKPSLTELRTALAAARISHKRAILGGDVRGVVQTLEYLNRLDAEYEAALDWNHPELNHRDNTYEATDLGNGFHVVPYGRVAV